MILKKLTRRFGVNKFYLDNIDENIIGVMDTSVATLNVGDEIINDACSKILFEIFQKEQHLRFTTHDGISSIGISRANRCKYRMVCGTNLLSSRMFLSGQFNYGPLDVIRLRKLALMGVGWTNYQGDVSLYSKWFFKTILCPNTLHSVRDEYTKNKLNSIGIENVVNTGCPTMWRLSKEHCKEIPLNKSSNVIFTLTDYRKDKRNDSVMIEILKRAYKKVYFWVQGSEDLTYFNDMGDIVKDVIIVPPKLEKYDSVLSQGDIDYVGTRLHAGVRALQHKRRTVIIGVDNRANEKSKDFNMPVVGRSEIYKLEGLIDNEWGTRINLRSDDIERWRSQFK